MTTGLMNTAGYLANRTNRLDFRGFQGIRSDQPISVHLTPLPPSWVPILGANFGYLGRLSEGDDTNGETGLRPTSPQEEAERQLTKFTGVIGFGLTLPPEIVPGGAISATNIAGPPSGPPVTPSSSPALVLVHR
jgi:hypothetical protein